MRAIRRVSLTLAAISIGLAAASPDPAVAAVPQIVSTEVVGKSVHATTVDLGGWVNPEGLATTFRFEYLTEAAYLRNLETLPEEDWLTGASWKPSTGQGSVGTETIPTELHSQHLERLTPDTAYRYRLRAENSSGASFGATRPFRTQPATNVFELLDHRGWEMVSPIEKDGGAVQPPGTISEGGVFQASAAGGSFTFSSADPFGAGTQGAPSGSQYIATRGGGGWTTANITTPLLSGSYGSEPNGVPYQLFSSDLAFGLLSNGERCRGQVTAECPVVNPPLPGTGAPPGYRNFYRRNASGSYQSLLTAGDRNHTALGPDQLELHLVAATPDLAHVVLSSCAALTAAATEVAGPQGCNPADQNLYEWSGGELSLVNLLPGEVVGTPGAQIAAPSGAISSDGSRIYFTSSGSVYLREGAGTKTVSGPGAEFAGASTDGSIGYLIDGGQLIRYLASSGTLTPVTAGGRVEGVLGMSAGGSKVYYADSGAVFLLDGATVTEVASSALPRDWPSATGTARVTPDGSHLLFLSAAELTGYPNRGATEVFLYGPPPGGTTAALSCVSCNPSGEDPQGNAAIPGARSNGGKTGATDVYKPRDLSADGSRVFFESPDPLASQDTNKATDVYEWEADGAGTCGRSGGCVQLISGGRSLEPSYFLDADEDGSEAFFLTPASLYSPDPGSYDVYDARVGGGFDVPETPIPCIADACQVLPEAPEDPTPGTLVPNSGNPALKIAGGRPKGKAGTKKHHKKKHRRRAPSSSKGKHHGGRR